MVCIYCGHKKTSVINSRPHKSVASVWRRRQCPSCQRIVSTYEAVAEDYMPLVTYPDRTPPQALNVFRLALSFSRYLDRSNRQLDPYDLANTVAQKAIAAGYSELSRHDLTKLSYQTLSAFDRPAGAQYGIRHGIIALN